MDAEAIRKVLASVSSGRMTVEQALAQLKRLPFEDLSYACVDHHRALRKGFPEVIFGQNKTLEQIMAISERIVKSGGPLLITRLPNGVAPTLLDRYPNGVDNPQARTFHWIDRKPRFCDGRVSRYGRAGCAYVP